MINRFIATLTCAAVLCSQIAYAQYTHPTTGQQNTFIGACPVTLCSGTFTDNGGSGGNYAANIPGTIRTFCAENPGEQLRATFTGFSMNDTYFLCFGPNSCCDYLQIFDGPTIESPMIYNNCTTSPGTVTSTSGCLTFRFVSDGSVQLAGWNATLSCVAGSGGQPAGTTSDCANATSLWTSGPVTDPATGPGLVAEGCSGCVVGEYNSTWRSLCIQSSGTLAFTIDPNNNATDYNFAVYGPNVSCGVLGTPVRCSGASVTGDGNTGLGNGAVDNSEDINGNQWVAPLDVTAGETYYVLINRYTDANPGFNFTFTGTAGLENCDAPFVYNLSKTIAGTSVTGTSDTQDGSTGSERPVAIGEVVTYSLSFAIPEGTTNNLSIVDNLPAGMQYVIGSAVFNQTSDNGISYATTVTGGAASGQAVAFALGNVTNNDNDPNAETIEITFEALVVNEVGNQDGTLLTNQAELKIGGNTLATSESRTVAVVEPSVSISTTTNVGTDVDAGDQVKFTINLNNTGTATAYNLQVTDVLPFAGISSFVNFEAVDLAASTCDELDGFTVNAATPPNVVFGFDALAANASCSITFTGIVTASVSPNETYTNQVSLTSYTSQPNAVAADVRTYIGNSASSVITTKEPVLAKSYVSTSEAHTDPGDTRTGTSNANEIPLAIGEIIRYSIAITLIEGLHNNLLIEDLLPGGIEALYNSNFKVTIPAGVNTGIAGLVSGATTSIYNNAGAVQVAGFNLAPNPGALSFYFGPVSINNNTNNSADEVIVVSFDALVLNTTTGSNDIGDQRDNLATFSEGSGTSFGQSNTVHARILEPVVTIAKTLNTTLSNPASVSTFKNGDEVVYDIVLTAGNATNQTTAFDLSVLDNLNADLDLVSVAFVGTPAYATTVDNSDYTAPGQSVNVSISELRPGDAITIRVTATIASNACTGTINNTASMTYTSLPGLKGTNDATPGDSGTDKGERNGSGGINDYSGSDDAMINIDQHPDFTLNVVQPTCEMAGSISFAALTEGTYTYAFSTNGVDYTPLTPNMGQVSIVLLAGDQPAATYSIRVTPTDLATACETIKTANIQEVSDCCPDISAILSGTTTICPGSGADISVAITGGSGNYTVVYSPDGGNTTGTVNNYSSGAAIVVMPAQTTTYTLISVTDAENCPAVVSGSAVVTVEDVTDPVFDCNTLLTITANTASNACNANVSITAPVATDNCDGQIVATGARSDQAALSAPYLTGTTTITWTFEDAAGNSIQCMQNVVVTDNTPPTITCPATQTLVLGANCTATLPNYTSLATTGDNCGVQSVTQSPTAGTTVSGAGNMTVTLTVTDINGNPMQCTFTVTKVDNTPPNLVCKVNTILLAATDSYTLLAADVFDAGASSDNCSGELAVTNISPATVNCSQLGMTIPVTVTVQDAAGNSATCIAQITVQEGTTTPVGWNSNNVGNANGSSGYKPCTSAGQFTVAATGFSMSSSDVLHLTSRQLCGNGEIIARIASVTNGGWAGITLRESLAPGAKMVALKTQSNGNIRRMIRTTTNGAANNLNYSRPQHNWLRLVRDGSNFVGYTSLNGTNWTFAFSATVSMTGCIYAGLFAESINNSVTTTATFDNVQITGSALPLIQAPQIPTTASIFSPEVYPNPTTGEVNIDLGGYADPVGTIRVLDVFGKLVKAIRLDGSSLFRMKLDDTDGVYFLSIEVAGEVPVTKRVVIAH